MNQTAEILHDEIEKRDVRGRATLVTLHIRQWTARKYDRKASDKVASDHHATSDAGRYHKRLVDVGAYLKPIKQTADDMRATHYLYTLPWLDNGQRILPIAHYEAYCERMNKLANQFNKRVHDFIDVYPQAKQQARAWLGELYDEADYPDPEQARAKFEADYYMQPMPSAEDFRVDLSEADIDKAADKIELAVKQAQSEAWQRLADCVEAIATRLPKYSSGDMKYLRESIITNLVEVADLVPGMNILQQPELDKLAREARDKLASHSITALRDNDELRSRKAREAEAILSKMRFNMSIE